MKMAIAKKMRPTITTAAGGSGAVEPEDELPPLEWKLPPPELRLPPELCPPPLLCPPAPPALASAPGAEPRARVGPVRAGRRRK